ncbi:hypothetical protein BDM02DRAFT_3174566 [Thelephora ganbajun]|uniref:Uncharacterized protein n=1 Tax=Thelephora ganbajun TaxID=370292 RepID=A0ACB6Z454_THEGA|nr:hypothetical protein BDM02DRAFT_3174566 [Thelephora ganbajun]
MRLGVIICKVVLRPLRCSVQERDRATAVALPSQPPLDYWYSHGRLGETNVEISHWDSTRVLLLQAYWRGVFGLSLVLNDAVGSEMCWYYLSRQDYEPVPRSASLRHEARFPTPTTRAPHLLHVGYRHVRPSLLRRKPVQAVSGSVPEACLGCNKDGTSPESVDASHIARLRRTGFAKHHDYDRPIALGINPLTLTKLLECTEDDDVCTLTAVDNPNALKLILEAKKAGRISTHTFGLTDICTVFFTLLDTESDVRVTVSSAAFGHIIENLAIIGEEVKIDTPEEGAGFSVEGNILDGEVLVEPKVGSVSEGEVSIHVKSPVAATFELVYLSKTSAKWG